MNLKWINIPVFESIKRHAYNILRYTRILWSVRNSHYLSIKSRRAMVAKSLMYFNGFVVVCILANILAFFNNKSGKIILLSIEYKADVWNTCSCLTQIICTKTCCFLLKMGSANNILLFNYSKVKGNLLFFSTK